MAQQTPEAKIRDLERRLDLDPGSRLFVSLAEEYRKLGRMRDALGALQKGLLAHPGYVAAQVALGRVYVELSASEIIKKKQWLSALNDQVVDAHRDEIDADRIVTARFDGYLHLGADAVRGRNQDWIHEPGRFRIEQRAEAA